MFVDTFIKSLRASPFRESLVEIKHNLWLKSKIGYRLALKPEKSKEKKDVIVKKITKNGSQRRRIVQIDEWTSYVYSCFDENQVKEAFIDEGRGHSPSHLKFFLLVFSKLKEDIK